MGKLDAAIVLLLMLCVACKRLPELADAPPTPVTLADAQKFLDRQVAVLRELHATDCGEMVTSIKAPLDCAQHELDGGRAFFLRTRGGTEGVVYGDARGNVTMFFYQVLIFRGSYCPVGGMPPVIASTSRPTVTMRQRPLMIAGSPVGRPFFTLPPRVLTRAPIAKSSAPYRVQHAGAYAYVSVDPAGAVTSCIASPWFAKKQICDSVERWSFIPATFLGRPVGYSRHGLMFEVNGDRITERDPRVRPRTPV